MRHCTLTLLVLVLLALTGVYASPAMPAGKTSDNLLAAYKGELTASVKYAGFSEQAHKDGYHQIGILFSAASKAESIHAANHKAVLEKLGTTIDPFTPTFTLGSTKENLEEAVSRETNEGAAMYPGYIATAKNENVSNAVKSMRWAMETEKKYIIYCQNALMALTNNTVSTLPRFYWVCPKCGNTYDTPTPENMCSFCGTASNRFVKVLK